MNDTATAAQQIGISTIRYALIVQWSDEDNCYIGSAPDLILGGCHGDDPRQVFDELCQIVDEVIADLKARGEVLLEPTDALKELRQRTRTAV